MRKSKGRPLNGILLLDKPNGISSNKALQIAKRLFGAQKAGHTGALDPLATGLLPICFGEGTKFSQYLLDSDKSYQVTAQLGVRTNTSDAEGDVVERRPVSVTLEQLEREINRFSGETEQIPSMFSALKYQGKPLYEYARLGLTVPRNSRKIHVYDIQLISFTNDLITLTIDCSKGTYIRTIIDDLGEQLGCGAHVSILRRTSVAHYPAEKMVTLDFLEQLVEQMKDAEPAQLYDKLDALLLPIDNAVQHLPIFFVDNEQQKLLQFGQPIFAPKETAMLVETYSLAYLNENGFRLVNKTDQQFLGIGCINERGLIQPKRLVVM